jgi:peptide/nickel transport system substrate-binding protein
MNVKMVINNYYTEGKMKKRIFNIQFIALMIFTCLIVSLLAIACEPSQPAPTSTTTTSQYGGILKTGMTTDPITLGWTATMSAATDVGTTRCSLETLARYDETGNLVPLLAEKWTLDDKTKTLTINLRKGVKFHDGTPFNATACKWNIDQYITAKRQEVASVASVDIVDDYTVKLNLKTWDNTIISLLVLPSGFMISPASFEKNGKDWCIKNPIGTGPFKFVSWDRDIKQVFAKNPDYWQKGKPYLDRVEFITIADPLVQLASLQKGEIDVLWSTLAKDVAPLLQQGTFNVANLKSGLGSAMRGLVGDSGHASSPFSKLQVRQAVSCAIDRDAINKGIFYGYGIVSNQLSIPGTVNYNPNLTNLPFNPAKAKSLLAEAGYPNGFSTKIYCRNDATSVSLYTAVQGMLSNVGINASIEALALAKQDQMAKDQGWTDGLMQFGVKVDPEILIQMRRAAHTGGDFYVFSTIQPKELDDLMDKAISVTDLNQKYEMTRQLQQMLFEKYTLFTDIVTLPSISVKNQKLTGDRIKEIEETTWIPEDARFK